MIQNPEVIFRDGIVSDLEGGSLAIQQNGIDITLESVEMVMGGSLGRDDKKINTYLPVKEDSDGWFHLASNQCYSVMFQQEVKVPENMIATVVQRSTLNRIGSFILSGVYDSGFQNTIGAILRTSSAIKIQKGARIAQIVFQSAESASLYDGSYQKRESVAEIDRKKSKEKGA